MRATYVLQTRYLADARGAELVGPALEQLVRAVRAASADVVAGGVAGGPLAQAPRGERQRDLSDLRGGVRVVDGGRRRDAERRAARLALRARRARGRRRRRLPRRLGRHAARLRGRGRGDAASASTPRSSVDAAGGAFPFWQVQADGLERRLLRFPVAVDDVPGEGPAAALAAAYVALRRNRGSGAPTLVELTPDRHGCAAAVERALLADTPPDVWRGTLDRLGGFWERARASRWTRGRSARAGAGSCGVAQRGPCGGQSLVAPFRVARAVGRRRAPAARYAAETASCCPHSAARRPSSSSPRARRSTGRGIQRLVAFRQAATRLPRQLTPPLKLRTRLSIGSLERGTHHRRRNS